METTHRTIAIAVVPGFSALAMAPALAASDYLLELEGVEGEAATKTTLELASWSFGASNPASMGPGGMSSGRRQHHPVRLSTPLPQNGTVEVVTAREAASGMATGRRACATGTHFPKATLSHGNRRWTLTDVTVSTCADDAMTLSYRSIATWDLKASKK